MERRALMLVIVGSKAKPRMFTSSPTTAICMYACHDADVSACLIVSTHAARQCMGHINPKHHVGTHLQVLKRHARHLRKQAGVRVECDHGAAGVLTKLVGAALQ